MTVFLKGFCTFSLGLALALPGLAQTSSPPADTPPASSEKPATPPAQEPAAPPAAPTWSVGPIDFSGLVDGYYSFNANHPASQTNQLYNFNDSTNQFSLNIAKLTLSHTADPVGFQVDLGFGRAFEIFNRQPSEKASDTFRFLEQAYVSLKPAKAKGLEIDLGKFVTSAGAEVIETNSNWNYSRSLLFALAIPYYHFGLRTSIPIGKYFTGGVQIVNGWNNVGDNNTGKTVGFTGTITTKKFAWSNNYYAGPENPNTNKGWRHLYDTTLLLTPSAKLNAYINFDYGQNRNFPLLVGTLPLSKWYGIAGALHLQPNSKWSFTPRVEWFKDRDGWATGVAQDLKEFTLTGEYKMLEGFLGRLEYRHDWSNMPFFDYGGTPASKKSQDTLTLGLLAFFGPKR
ncbi:MAG TPA: porin [Candidatus Dormibacteraeota bacterium]|nr:porin [Candidatus Dormibacteraeota bacterium]